MSSKYGTRYSVRVILQFMCVGSLAGVTYLRYTVLTRSKKAETAVHCCDPALSVLVVLVSRNVFHVVSALQPIAFIFLPQTSSTSHLVPSVQKPNYRIDLNRVISATKNTDPKPPITAN